MQQENEASIHHETVGVNGIQMHYVSAGSGPLLLLLHGFPEFWYSWRYQLTGCGAHCRVVVPDLRGYNDTERPAQGYEFETLLGDVAALVSASGDERATVAGDGWGGVLAWGLALHYPHMVERLIVLDECPALMNTLLPTHMSRPVHIAATLLLRVPGVLEQLLRGRDYARIEWLLRAPLANSAALSNEDIETYKDAISKPGALRAALAWYRRAVPLSSLFRRASLSALLHGANGANRHINVPTLLIRGELPEAGDDTAREATLKQTVPNLHIVTIPGASRRVLHEHPDHVTQAITSFMTGREGNQ